MYRCYSCDSPAQAPCPCHSFQPKVEETPERINVASGEDVSLEELELA